MKRVLLASMPVGGGHNALRDSFLKVIRDADPAGESFETVPYTGQDPRVPEFYDFCVHHVPWMNRVIWELGRTAAGIRMGVLANSHLYREAVAVLKHHRPDVVVCTHFLFSMMLAKARRALGLELTLVNAIPDYGEPTRAFYPEALDLRADYSICMDRSVYRGLVDGFGASPATLHLSGFIPRAPFVRVGKAIGEGPRLSQEGRADTLRRLSAAHPELSRFDLARPTLIFLGGSAWTEKTMPVLEQIIRNPEFADHLNVLVVSGKNESFQQALTARVAKLQRMFVFGFVSPDEMADLMSLADLPVLGSLAPATMHELLETRAGPMMLFHYIPGSEDAHGEWIRTHEVGLYEPDPYLMTDALMQATGFRKARPEIARLLAVYPQRARAIREDHLARALELPQLLAHVGQVAPLKLPAQPASPQPHAWDARARAGGGQPTRS